MISIIIPYFNNFYHLKNNCKILIKYLPKSSEIILVNDASTDNTQDNIKNFLKKFKKNIIKIFFILNKKNKGPGPSRNLGAKYAKFKNLVFIDSDIIIKKNTIKIIIENLKKYDAVIGIYSKKNCHSFIQRLKCYYYYSIFKINKNVKYSIFHSAIAGIKKKVFFDVGGFNPHFGTEIEYENEEFGYRVVQKKYKQYLVPKVEVHHQWGSDKKIIKTFIKRGAYYFQKILVTRKLEKNILGNSEILKVVINFLMVFAFFVSVFYINFLIFFLFTLYLHLKLNEKFYGILKKQNQNFIKYFFGILFLNICMVISLFYGIFSTLINKNNFNKKFGKK